MKGAGGRPQLNPFGPLFVWVFVELMRDRKGSTKRLSARTACRRLEKYLPKEFKGGRLLKFETIRRYHKNVAAINRRSDEEKAKAAYLLERGRGRREIFGWDASPWLFLIDPAVLESIGYEVVIRDDQITATKRN